MALLVAVLTEQKLLVHSLRPDVLTSVGEALVAVSAAEGTRRRGGDAPRAPGTPETRLRGADRPCPVPR